MRGMMLTDNAPCIPLLVIALVLLSLVPFSVSSPFIAAAAVTTSITPTTGAGNLGTTVVPPNNNIYGIRGGTTVGTNLFHSFGQFNVGPGDIAQFQTSNLSANAAISNILGRVTGQQSPSQIFGTIDSATYYPSANLFLMNPYGFLFGPNATINVGGMMTFTTADYLRLADGGRFNANPNAIPGDILTAAPVAAFGFLGANPAAINFEGGQLTVANGTGVMLVGGDINLNPDPVSGTPSSITAPGRPIVLTSVAGPGEVVADTGIPAAGLALGTVTLGQGTILSTASDLSFGDGSGGAVSIRGGQFVATGAQILTNPASGSTGQGGAVTITASDTASFTNSTIDTSSSFFAGSGGPVTITAGNSVTLTQQSLINTSSFFSNGDGGAVNITAQVVALEDSIITTGVLGDGTTSASGGAVTLGDNRTSSVSLTRSLIDTSIFDTAGNSGPVTITGSTITIVGNPPTPSIDTSIHNSSGDPTVAGHGGDITITGTNVTVSGSATSPNNAGPIFAFTLESVADAEGTFSRGGNIRISGSENIILNNGASLVTSTLSQGAAGDIDLLGPHVTISQSSLSSGSFSSGAGGAITITGTEDVALNSGTVISTTAVQGSSGPAGSITISTPYLTIAEGSRLTSKAAGSGPGGIVTIQGTSGPAQSVLISDPGSGIFTNTEGTGAGGNIFVNANSVTLQNGAHVSSSSTGTGIAGDITINAGNQFAMTNSSVTTEANHSSGGIITITTNPDGTVQLTDSKISASVLDGSGGGGSVNIDPQYVLLQNSQILAQAVQGPGGNITITTNLLLPDATSVISASSQFGVNGTITIQSPISQAGGKIQPLGKTPLLPTSLLNQRCAALAGGNFSSFTVAGRDSLPAEPGGWLSSPLALAISESSGGPFSEAGGVTDVRREAGGETSETPILSLRQIAPPGFLTQTFAVDWSGCTS